ncbi:hypothetical protein [Streptomyces sp. NPDC000618]|uniref:hypothetical protein n=1 Tax=Streptomyces sp. NPDC000618 TaxID=3154265 RepID=UPI003327C750
MGDPRGGQELGQVLAEPDGDDLGFGCPRAHGEFQGERGAHLGDVERVAVQQQRGQPGEVEQQEVARFGGADGDQPRVRRGYVAGGVFVQEAGVGGQSPPAGLPGDEGRLRLLGEVFGQCLHRAGSDPRGPQRRQDRALLLGRLVGQGPQGRVQAGGACWFGGGRQLGLCRVGL